MPAVIAVAVVLGVLWATIGCGRPDDARLVVAARLVERLDPRDGPIAGDRCPVDGERRPALGCTQWRTVATERAGVASEGPASRTIGLGKPHEAARPRILQWSVRAPGKAPPVAQPASVLAANDATVTVDLADVAGPKTPAGAELRLRARTVLPERVTTAPVDVPPGSVLTFGVAVDRTMPYRDVEAIELALSASTASGTRRLFETRLVPSDPATGRWIDHRVPLDEVAGPRVRFVFETRTVPRPGGDPAAVAALPLWGAPEILARRDAPALDVILISFDTLRADHLGVYGSDLPTSPNLDRLAGEGIVVDGAFATNPATPVSHMSMLTGRYPATTGVIQAGRPLAADVPTLATVLGAHGWRTGAVTENGMLQAEMGFSKGISFYRENAEPEKLGTPSRVAEATFDAATRWIAAHAGERFFLFLHTYVVHWPYEPPPEHDVFAPRDDGDVDAPGALPVKQLRRRYAGETRYGDALFGRLRAALERLGLANRTLIVVTSDHGDEFGEHGGWSHSRTLYDEVLHVPFILWAPERLGAARRVPGPASLVDLVPTVLAALGVPAPPGLDGRDVLAASPPGDRAVYAENTLDGVRQAMVRTADAKWIWQVEGERLLEAYDLAADPGERRPVRNEAFTARGIPRLRDYLARAPGAPSAPAAAPDPAHLEKLRALGYVE